MRRVRAAQPDVKFYAAESQLLQLSNFAAPAPFTARRNAAPWENLTWEKIRLHRVEVHGEGKFDKSEI